ncbi:hypothetical protein E2C01_061765 [Portunus trituberculatus]|uniref:Uncharacterized protein n=1 Tax=Portunus trituberculatus TaxID=210409 RepID=A0A5B7HCR7_PORTR|nr:hypothetical protein [Portunus trituberculatus]
MGYNQITEHRETRFCVRPGPRRLAQRSLERAERRPKTRRRVVCPTANNNCLLGGRETAYICLSEPDAQLEECPAMTVITTSPINYTRRRLAHLKPSRHFTATTTTTTTASSSSYSSCNEG